MKIIFNYWKVSLLIIILSCIFFIYFLFYFLHFFFENIKLISMRVNLAWMCTAYPRNNNSHNKWEIDSNNTSEGRKEKLYIKQTKQQDDKLCCYITSWSIFGMFGSCYWIQLDTTSTYYIFILYIILWACLYYYEAA